MKKNFIIVMILSLFILNIFSSCKSYKGNDTSSTTSSITSSTASSESSSQSKESSNENTTSKKEFENPDENSEYQKAYALYAKKDYDGAINICNAEIKSNPNCFWGYNLKGISKYFANGNSVADECIKLIDKSVEINEDYYYGYFNRALIEKGTKKFDASIKDFQKVIELKPDDTWSYYGIATVYADTSNKEETLKYLKLALNLDRENVKEAVKDDMTRHFSKLKNDNDFKALIK